VKADISKVDESQICEESVQDKEIGKSVQRMQRVLREQERCELGTEVIDRYLHSHSFPDAHCMPPAELKSGSLS
jgi:hypothetical protein